MQAFGWAEGAEVVSRGLLDDGLAPDLSELPPGLRAALSSGGLTTWGALAAVSDLGESDLVDVLAACGMTGEDSAFAEAAAMLRAIALAAEQPAARDRRRFAAIPAVVISAELAKR